MSDETSTRRTLLHGSALLGVAALLDACSASAGGGNVGPDGSVLPLDGGVPAGSDAGVDAGPSPATIEAGRLNALLGVEYTLIAAYAVVIPILMQPPTGDPLQANGPALSVIATSWQEHHRAHARELVSAVTALGATPVAESSVTFTAPTGFTATVRNAMVLLCNAEKGAAVAYNQAVAVMTTADARYLATIIEGAEAQHFVVLYTLLKQVVAPNATMLITMINEIAPKAFVNSVGSMPNGLSSIAPFNYSA